MARSMLVLFGLFALGCAAEPPVPVDAGPTGKLLLRWTLDGKSPSAASCGRIDHLEVHVMPASGEIVVSPVPCQLEQWRYDGFDLGLAAVWVVAIDAKGCTVSASPAVETTIGNAIPPEPVEIPMTTTVVATC